MENGKSERPEGLSVKDLKDLISNDSALKKQLTTGQGILHSSDIFDLFSWSLAISYAVGIFSSLTADKLKERLNKDRTISRKDLREIMPLLETKLEAPDLSKLEESVELSREVLLSFNLEDTDKKIEIKMVERIKGALSEHSARG